MNALPFEILKHEFNHLLLGGNNFHSGGGNAPMFQSYFMSLQGGWSMMGAANSSLLTACAVSYTHLRAHETVLDLVCRLLLEKKKKITHYYDLSYTQNTNTNTI